MGAKKPNRCHLCGQRILWSYIVYDNGLTVCEHCNRTVAHCSRCNLPSYQLAKVRDGLLCPICLKEVPVCALCHEPIVGSYLTYNKTLIVCEYCDRTVPHCNQCNNPSHQLTKVRGVLICPACLQKLPVCACCQQPILGQTFIIGDSPERYCESCMTTRPRCDICTVPLNAQGKVFSGRDGNIYRCANCYRTAVKVEKEAERLYAETHALLKRELLLDIPMLPKLNLVDRAKLAELHQQIPPTRQPDKPAGTEQHLLGFFHSIGKDQNIYIEQLLPQTLFRAVAAHELAHAWQSLHAPSGQSVKIVEGFAEWVAYRTLQALGEQREAARLTRRDDLYGEGLQYFIALERQHGRKAILQRAMQV